MGRFFRWIGTNLYFLPERIHYSIELELETLRDFGILTSTFQIICFCAQWTSLANIFFDTRVESQHPIEQNASEDNPHKQRFRYIEYYMLMEIVIGIFYPLAVCHTDMVLIMNVIKFFDNVCLIGISIGAYCFFLGLFYVWSQNTCFLQNLLLLIWILCIIIAYPTFWIINLDPKILLAILPICYIFQILQTTLNIYIFDHRRISQQKRWLNPSPQEMKIENKSQSNHYNTHRSLILVFINYIALIFAFGIIYYIFRDQLESHPDFGQCVYFSTITQLTVGYGDIRPICHWMQLVSSIQGLLGIFFIGLIITQLVNALPEIESIGNSP